MMHRARILAAFAIGLATTPIAVAISAWLGLFGVSATDVPPTSERRLAGRALDTSVSRSARGLTAPFVDDDQTLLAGLKLDRP
jgi:hypothetical protein